MKENREVIKIERKLSSTEISLGGARYFIPAFLHTSDLPLIFFLLPHIFMTFRACVLCQIFNIFFVRVSPDAVQFCQHNIHPVLSLNT